MEPIGLTIKNIKINPFTKRTTGELMIVHLCLGCGKISCNRIAGDDNSHAITCLLEKSNNLNQETIIRLSTQGIRLTTQEDKQKVLTSLYGYDYLEHLK